MISLNQRDDVKKTIHVLSYRQEKVGSSSQSFSIVNSTLSLDYSQYTIRIEPLRKVKKSERLEKLLEKQSQFRNQSKLNLDALNAFPSPTFSTRSKPIQKSKRNPIILEKRDDLTPPINTSPNRRGFNEDEGFKLSPLKEKLSSPNIKTEDQTSVEKSIINDNNDNDDENAKISREYIRLRKISTLQYRCDQIRIILNHLEEKNSSQYTEELISLKNEMILLGDEASKNEINEEIPLDTATSTSIQYPQSIPYPSGIIPTFDFLPYTRAYFERLFQKLHEVSFTLF
jgi:hypothetical protein